MAKKGSKFNEHIGIKRLVLMLKKYSVKNGQKMPIN